MPNAIFFETTINEAIGDPKSDKYAAIKLILFDMPSIGLLDLIELGLAGRIITLSEEDSSEAFRVIKGMPQSVEDRIMSAIKGAFNADMAMHIYLSLPIVPGSYHATVGYRSGRTIIDIEAPYSVYEDLNDKMI